MTPDRIAVALPPDSLTLAGAPALQTPAPAHRRSASHCVEGRLDLELVSLGLFQCRVESLVPGEVVGAPVGLARISLVQQIREVQSGLSGPVEPAALEGGLVAVNLPFTRTTHLCTRDGLRIDLIEHGDQPANQRHNANTGDKGNGDLAGKVVAKQTHGASLQADWQRAARWLTPPRGGRDAPPHLPDHRTQRSGSSPEHSAQPP